MKTVTGEDKKAVLWSQAYL